ncbi:MAG TPA: sterol desaturase family protein [Chitinophagales bacterium]|nr:sterol desaturase family protein [Chitinophagales bacterium]
MLAILFFAGIASWTLAEYLMHRFLGHVHKGKNFFKEEHLLHHSKANYFAPVYKKAALAVMATLLLIGIISLFAPLAAAIAFTAGFVAMYGMYENTHYRYHSKEPVAAPFIHLRKHHFYHHFHNPKMNHGVTTRFWDRVFGTFKSVEKVNIPKQMRMQWLLDGETIKDTYAEHFRLSGR